MKPRNFLLIKNKNPHTRIFPENKLAIQIEKELKKIFGEQVKFYKYTFSKPTTNIYYVSTNTSRNQITETNKQIYKFINYSSLPPPIYHEGFYEKNDFVYSGLAHFAQNTKKLTLLKKESRIQKDRIQKEYTYVFFALNDKLAELTSQGIIHRIRVSNSDIEQFSKNNRCSEVKKLFKNCKIKPTKMFKTL